MSHAQIHPFDPHDPEFQEPEEKTFGPERPPNSFLAVVSLLTGIASFALPVFGPLIAIVTGHVALGEIKHSKGTLGGRSLAKVGLILGYTWLVLAVAFAVVIFSMVVVEKGDSTVFGIHSVSPGLPKLNRSVVPGVQSANELEPGYVAWLKARNLIGPDEPIICAYVPVDSFDRPFGELAVLTPRRLHYVKQSNVTTLDLNAIESVLGGEQFLEKYGSSLTNSDGIEVYPIEVIGTSGLRMRLRIDPHKDGPVFDDALNSAWKTAKVARLPRQAQIQGKRAVIVELPNRPLAPPSIPARP